LKLQKVAIVSKVGSKDSEQAAKDIAKKLLAKKSTIYTISPIQVEGAKQLETLEELKKIKLRSSHNTWWRWHHITSF